MVLKVSFERELEQKFRELAMRRYGYIKGAIKKASREAIKRWITEESQLELSESKDPMILLKKLEGCMKHLRGKYTSVELQHEAAKLWTN